VKLTRTARVALGCLSVYLVGLLLLLGYRFVKLLWG
jgi:hypothetical protein